MVDPNGRKLDYVYNAGLDSSISRGSSINDDAAPSSPLEAYQYLGLNTIVRQTRANNTDLTYIGSGTGPAGDKYVGLDAFGRIVDQNWQVTSTGVSTDRFQYGYDADGNVLYKSNLMSTSNSELYHANGSTNGYDALNRLVAFSRGTLNGTNDSITSPSHTTTWTLDVLGNRTGLTDTTTGTTTEGFNARNEVSSISGKTYLTGSSLALTPVFDKNGNMTKDEIGNQYVYDAWNRLVKVKNSSGTVLETFTYDALGRRITQTVGSTTSDFYYDTSGKVLEERQGSTTTAQYVWGLGYVNELIERDAGGVRMYAQQDANWNVTSLTDNSGSGTVQERYQYDPYGNVTVLTPTFTVRGTGKVTASSYGWLYLFQDGRIDATTMLYHFGKRDYSASLSRWTEPDGGYWDGANLYLSFASNPASGVDPLGTKFYRVGGTAPTPGKGDSLAVPGYGNVQIYTDAGISLYDNKTPENSNKYIWLQFDASKGGCDCHWLQFVRQLSWKGAAPGQFQNDSWQRIAGEQGSFWKPIGIWTVDSVPGKGPWYENVGIVGNSGLSVADAPSSPLGKNPGRYNPRVRVVLGLRRQGAIPSKMVEDDYAQWVRRVRPRPFWAR